MKMILAMCLICVFLTWAVPSWTTLITIDQYSKAKKTTVWGCRIIRAALRLIEEEQLATDAYKLCTFIHYFCIWRLQTHKDNLV